jgi:RNA polymerase sigma-70 factor (ECF subfamily)
MLVDASRHAGAGACPEPELLALLRRGDAAAFALLMQQNNRRLYRLARSILHDEGEAEESLQEAYVRAFTHLHEYAGHGSLAGWLSRIVINEALTRRRRRKPLLALGEEDADGSAARSHAGRTAHTPEQDAARVEIRRMIEQAIDALPLPFRTVFMLRAVEELSIAETAATLGIPPDTVKSRLHRANQLLRRALHERLASMLEDVFPFAGAHCQAVQEAVLAELRRRAVVTEAR